MTFQLFGIDTYWSERLFGFWLVAFVNTEKEIHKSLFGMYWNDGNFTIDLLWFRAVDTWPRYWLDKILGL